MNSVYCTSAQSMLLTSIGLFLHFFYFLYHCVLLNKNLLIRLLLFLSLSWDATYDRELGEFQTHGDLGEVWFGEESEERLLEWLSHSFLPSVEGGLQSCSVIDLGTGNGHFLLQLVRNILRWVLIAKAVCTPEKLYSKLFTSLYLFIYIWRFDYGNRIKLFTLFCK